MATKIALKDQVYITLKKKIINNEYPSNSYIEEKDVCQEFNVSRTPVREAMARLERENFVILVPQKGARVREMTLQATVDIFKIRKTIEPLLVTMACKESNFDSVYLLGLKEQFRENVKLKDFDKLHQLDHEFHQYLFQQSRNPHLVTIMSYISDQFQRVRTQSFNAEQRTLEGAMQHLAIIDAILTQEYDTLQKLLLQHIMTNEEHFLRGLLNN